MYVTLNPTSAAPGALFNLKKMSCNSNFQSYWSIISPTLPSLSFDSKNIDWRSLWTVCWEYLVLRDSNLYQKARENCMKWWIFIICCCHYLLLGPNPGWDRWVMDQRNKKNACKVLVWKLRERDHFENLQVDGRIIVKVLTVSTLLLLCPIQEDSNF